MSYNATRDFERIHLENSERVVDDVMRWFEKTMHWAEKDNWSFKVSEEGKYLKATPKAARPKTLKVLLAPRATLELRIPNRTIQTKEVLEETRLSVHKVVTLVLWRAIGKTKANRALALAREIYNLPKLREYQEGEYTEVK